MLAAMTAAPLQGFLVVFSFFITFLCSRLSWLFVSFWAHVTTTPHHNRFTAFIRDHPGEPVPEENFWTLWCKGRLTEANTQTIRLGATPSVLTIAHLHHSPIFYRPDALPAAQPTVSKH